MAVGVANLSPTTTVDTSAAQRGRGKDQMVTTLLFLPLENLERERQCCGDTTWVEECNGQALTDKAALGSAFSEFYIDVVYCVVHSLHTV